MRVTPSARRREAGGFSLVEALVAAGLLLLTVTGVTAVVTNVSRAGSRLDATMAAQRAVRMVVGRLSALPYCAASLPQAPPQADDEAADLLGAVFPHAREAANTTEARYVPAGEAAAPAGSFVTTSEEAGVAVTCLARFRLIAAGEWLAPDDLAAWDAHSASQPPAPVLEVEVSARSPGGVFTHRLVRSAGATPGFASAEGAVP